MSKTLDGYYNVERARQAGALCDMLRQAGMGINEMCLLKILGRKMGRETTVEGQIKDGCRASLETLERESLLERRAIGKALGRLVDAGFITKTMDRDRRVAGELTKEGQRLQDMGLPTDASHVRQPLGRPRKDGSSAAQWQHCIYRAVVEVWNSIQFDGPKDRTAAQTVSTEVSAADKAVLDEIVDGPPPAETESEVKVTEQNLDEVFRHLGCYFPEHPTMGEAKARKLMINVLKDLARRAIDIGHIQRAGDFLWWLQNHKPDEFTRLMNVVQQLGSPMGLLQSAKYYWEEFAQFIRDIDAEEDGETANSELDDQESDDYDAHRDETDDEWMARNF
jgi:DNA-binding MarR family transcriptional regulator